MQTAIQLAMLIILTDLFYLKQIDKHNTRSTVSLRVSEKKRQNAFHQI